MWEPELRRAGAAAQRQALTLLQGDDNALLPLRAGTRLHTEGVDCTTVDPQLLGVDVDLARDPDEADVNLIRLRAPWQSGDGVLDDFFHSGSLAFGPDAVDRVQALAAKVPTIVVVYLERPAILTPLLDSAAVLIGDFGASDQVVLDALVSAGHFTGRLPFDIPRSQQAVDSSREDVPFDTADPVFRSGAGIAAMWASPHTPDGKLVMTTGGGPAHDRDQPCA